jgi:hypothetical protein
MLPCPFCGGSPIIKIGGCDWENPIDANMGFWVECPGCGCELGNNSSTFIDGCTGGIFDSEAEAVNAWNKRSEGA